MGFKKRIVYVERNPIESVSIQRSLLSDSADVSKNSSPNKSSSSSSIGSPLVSEESERLWVEEDVIQLRATLSGIFCCCSITFRHSASKSGISGAPDATIGCSASRRFRESSALGMNQNKFFVLTVFLRRLGGSDTLRFDTHDGLMGDDFGMVTFFFGSRAALLDLILEYRRLELLFFWMYIIFMG